MSLVGVGEPVPERALSSAMVLNAASLITRSGPRALALQTGACPFPFSVPPRRSFVPDIGTLREFLLEDKEILFIRPKEHYRRNHVLGKSLVLVP
ncbi:MAG: hypothetical protein Tsb008_14830 [Rhodothalassiaceae bacterium]